MVLWKKPDKGSDFVMCNCRYMHALLSIALPYEGIGTPDSKNPMSKVQAGYVQVVSKWDLVAMRALR
jgi:hypothetical protein